MKNKITEERGAVRYLFERQTENGKEVWCVFAQSKISGTAITFWLGDFDSIEQVYLFIEKLPQ